MALSHTIMTALLEDDFTGYGLAKYFDTSMGFFWRASHQQIYQELRKMAEKEWLSARVVEQVGKFRDRLQPFTGIFERSLQFARVDRQVVVLGGLISDDVQIYEQRVPLLGSIPFLGRLFRSEASKVVKNNL